MSHVAGNPASGRKEAMAEIGDEPILDPELEIVIRTTIF